MEAYELLERGLAASGQYGRHPVVCASGTAALHLALEALRLPQGSKVAVPDYTMVACARAVTLAGLTPVFVRSREEDLLLDTGALAHAAAADRGIRAVMPVHVYGRRCNMRDVHHIALSYDLYVIEDLAEAHGVPPHPYSDAACWSFYKNKIVAGEEGGCVTFQYEAEADRARQLRTLGFTKEHDYTHAPRGHNYRMSNTHAGLVHRSLGMYHDNVKARRENEKEYEKHCPQDWRMPPRDAPWVYDVRLPRGACRQTVVQALRAVNIQARHGFKPMTLQPEYAGLQTGPATPASWDRVIYLPLDPHQPAGNFRLAFEVIHKNLPG